MMERRSLGTASTRLPTQPHCNIERRGGCGDTSVMQCIPAQCPPCARLAGCEGARLLALKRPSQGNTAAKHTLI